MSEYTPDAEEARHMYKNGAWLKGREGVSQFDPDEYRPVYFAEFDRFLAEVERAAAEKAWDSAMVWVHANAWVNLHSGKAPILNPYREGKR